MRPIGRLTHGRQQSVLAALHHRASFWSTRISDGRSLSSCGRLQRASKDTNADQPPASSAKLPARDEAPSNTGLSRGVSQDTVDDGGPLGAIQRLYQYVNKHAAPQKQTMHTDDHSERTIDGPSRGTEPAEQLSEYDRAVIEQRARASSPLSAHRHAMERKWNVAPDQQTEDRATGVRIRKKRALALRAMNELRLRKQREERLAAESLGDDEGISSIVPEAAVQDPIFPDGVPTTGVASSQLGNRSAELPRAHEGFTESEETLADLSDVQEEAAPGPSVEETALGQSYEEGPLIYNLLPNSNTTTVDEERRFPGRWGSEKRFPAFYGNQPDSESGQRGKSLLRGLRLTDSGDAEHEIRPGHVSKTAVLIKGVSPNVKKEDFLRLAPTGLSGWAMQIKKIEQSRGATTLNSLSSFKITFHSPLAARAYCDRLLRLHKLSQHKAKHAPNNYLWKASVPPTLLSSPDADPDDELKDFTIVPSPGPLLEVKRCSAQRRLPWVTALEERLSHIQSKDHPPVVLLDVSPAGTSKELIRQTILIRSDSEPDIIAPFYLDPTMDDALTTGNPLKALDLDIPSINKRRLVVVFANNDDARRFHRQFNNKVVNGRLTSGDKLAMLWRTSVLEW